MVIGEEVLGITSDDLKRLHLVRQYLEKQIKQKEASAVLGVSGRQFRRLVKRMRKEGDGGIIHRSRGRPSNRRISEKTRRQVLRLYERKYNGFGPTLASEKLKELDAVGVNAETLRLWLKESGSEYKRRKSRFRRQRRERRFSVAAAQTADVHRPAPRARELDAVLCIKTERRLNNDWTVAHGGKVYQVEDRIVGKRVFVEERMDGSLCLRWQGKSLKYKELPARPKRVSVPSKSRVARQKHQPSMDHPWKQGYGRSGAAPVDP